jgi:hypothetical protein
MTGKVSTVREYLAELEKSKKEKPDQVREALDIYLDLWRRTVKSGAVGLSDPITEALAKIEGKGGLYRSAGD